MCFILWGPCPRPSWVGGVRMVVWITNFGESVCKIKRTPPQVLQYPPTSRGEAPQHSVCYLVQYDQVVAAEELNVSCYNSH